MPVRIAGLLTVGDKRFELVECGFKMESNLQKLIEEHPDLLGELFGVRLVNCGKVSFSNGLEADLVMLSISDRGDATDYVPMIVEVKKADNREARREVLAQLLEYMSAAYMEPEKIIQACIDKGRDNMEFDPGILRRNVTSRRMIGVIVSESIPDILKKTIEFVNEELSNSEVYGVELKRLCAAGSPEYSVIIPVLVGATIEAERRKQRATRIFWTYEELRKAYSNFDNEALRDRLLDLLEWARERGLLVEYASSEPRFKIAGVIYVNPDGKLYVRFGRSAEAMLPKPVRQRLLEGLQRLDMLPTDIRDADEVDEGKITLKSIVDLSEEEYSQLKGLLEDLLSS